MSLSNGPFPPFGGLSPGTPSGRTVVRRPEPPLGFSYAGRTVLYGDGRRLVYAINDRLPSDINILVVEEAPDRFHACHDAVSRSYFYQISSRRTAFGKKYVWWVKDRLEVGEMVRAAELVVGRHDFAAFSERATKRDGQSTIVHVESAEITTDEHLIRIRITASHFLWKMVRRLIGSLVEVGRGRASVEDFARLIENTRSQSPLVPARVTAPPSGLFLESVDY